jgi:hypothetical protein
MPLFGIRVAIDGHGREYRFSRQSPKYSYEKRVGLRNLLVFHFSANTSTMEVARETSI